MDDEDVYVVQLEVLEGVLDGLDDLLPGQGLLLGPGDTPQHLSTSASSDMEKSRIEDQVCAQILLVCANVLIENVKSKKLNAQSKKNFLKRSKN